MWPAVAARSTNGAICLGNVSAPAWAAGICRQLQRNVDLLATQRLRSQRSPRFCSGIAAASQACLGLIGEYACVEAPARASSASEFLFVLELSSLRIDDGSGHAPNTALPGRIALAASASRLDAEAEPVYTGLAWGQPSFGLFLERAARLLQTGDARSALRVLEAMAPADAEQSESRELLEALVHKAMTRPEGREECRRLLPVSTSADLRRYALAQISA